MTDKTPSERLRAYEEKLEREASDTLRPAGTTGIPTGDSQQFPQDQRFQMAENGGTVPTVKLLWMTPDPLGAVAALASMYEGRVIRDMSDLTDEDRRRAWENTQATHLRAPLEAVKLHFLIEGVDRAFTHQLVRQRTAVYAQESLRFAVVDDLRYGSTLPPSLQGTIDPRAEGIVVGYDYRADKPQQWRDRWDDALKVLDDTYRYLVDDGMPAEEARGLLPHCTATRIQYVTDLRNLSEHAGNRLCTQAQFHWRLVFAQIIRAIRNYEIYDHESGGWTDGNWQQEAIADSALFRPICYQLGHCPFQASFDRACTIRDRVEKFHKHGLSSDHWSVPAWVPVMTQDEGERGDETLLEGIQDNEWRMDPGAARA